MTTVQCLGFGIEGSGFRVQGLKYGVEIPWFLVRGLGVRVQGLRLRFSCLVLVQSGVDS